MIILIKSIETITVKLLISEFRWSVVLPGPLRIIPRVPPKIALMGRWRCPVSWIGQDTCS